MVQSVLVVGLHVYLMQKLIKILEGHGHFVVSVFSSDLVGRNLRDRKFDIVLVNVDVNPRLRRHVEEAVSRYQPDCPVIDALYEEEALLEAMANAPR